MRLHSLDVRAFGPFAGEESVDLDALAESGLFLLHGPTGAGKTSVLDAICYALYGVVPGARQRGGRLRSDHAAEGVAPEVRLELTVAGRRLEITRSPAWDRPKRRGTGTTTEQARTLVRELTDEGWRELTSRNDEAGHLIRSVTGMSADQFTQVVLLPQGLFAEFLRADAEARRPLLEQLFATERFSAVESWLADARRSLDRQVAEADRQVADLVARAAQAAGVDTDEAEKPLAPERAAAAETATDETASDGTASDGTAAVGAASAEAESDESTAGDIAGEVAGGSPALRWLRRVADLAATEADDAARAAEAARAVDDEATGELARVELLAAHRGRHAAALAEQATLADADATHQARLDELSAARLASPVVAHLRSAELAERRLDEASAAARTLVDRARTLAGAIGADLAVVPTAAELRATAGTLHAEVGRMHELERDADELVALHQRITATTAEHEAAAAALAGDLRALEDAPRHRLALDEQVAAARAAAAALPGLEAAAAVAGRRAAAVAELARLSREVDDRESELRAAVDDAQAAQQVWLELREARLAGIAAELAERLEPDTACPVCGSEDHPAPALPAQRRVREDDEAQAHAHAEELRGLREQAQARVDRLREEVSAASARAIEGLGTGATAPDLPASRVALASAQESLDQAHAEASTLVAREDALAAHDRETDERRTRVAEATSQQSAREALLADLTARTGALATSLRAALGDDPSPQARGRRFATAAEALEAAAAALDRVDDAEGERHRCATASESAAAAAGFPDVAAAAVAVRDEVAVAELERRCREHEAAHARVAATLQDPDVLAAAAAPAPDLAVARAAVAAARAGRDATAAERELLSKRATSLTELRDRLSALEHRHAPLRARARLVGDLSRLAEGTGGGNALRMRLSSFVLAARLEAVAEAASERLQRMSGGRYALVHTDEVTGRGRSGLGLRVVDAWTGVERDTTTLSGGESFFASLALALGLADVVQAEAGGRRLDTLFVDEGFGSLDEDTLDEVMDVLDGLRDGGRCVGLVSHVGDLRTRIPAQLHVEKGRQGSRLRLAVPA